MNFELITLDPAGACAARTDALIVVATDKMTAGKDALGRLAAMAIKEGNFDTKAGKLLQLYHPTGVVAPRVVWVGAGDGAARQVRAAVAAAVQSLRGAPAKHLTVCFAAPASEAAVRAAVLAAAEASYVYTTTKPKADARRLLRVTLGVSDAGAVKAAFEQAVATVRGVETAKEWGNRPANFATPSMLADAAKALCKPARFSCEVLGPKQVEKLGMGSFLSVAQGSAEPLRFIVMRYQGAAKAVAPTVLVGKGVTFDTGGISIKPAAEMDEMKFDMCGAASVLGVFSALAELKPAINVVGLIPACENMPDGRSIKPGDVVTSMSGQTIEILNTDAEGRLILCDALTYATRFQPRAVVDIATLTGACVIALGAVRSGMFSANDDLANALHAAGEQAQDLCWRMPLDEEYADGLKTNFADVANVGGRAGGAISAAKFLQRFASTLPWAHLDIAGTAWKSGPAKGSTGRPVGLLLQFLLTQDAVPSAPAPKAPKAPIARPTRKVAPATTKARKVATPAAPAPQV
jgi:leucyl aminopeptidase